MGARNSIVSTHGPPGKPGKVDTLILGLSLGSKPKAAPCSPLREVCWVAGGQKPLWVWPLPG